jgi:uncharacterized membrane protein YfcA
VPPPVVSALEHTALAAVLFLASAVGVVTGSTSLVTVPAMLLFGVDPRVAVATNMLGLAFMSAGGALPFLGGPALDRRGLVPLALITVASSALGARLVFAVPARVLPGVIAVAMLAIVAFSVANPTAGLAEGSGAPSRGRLLAGYALTFVLGVYGGFFSGGYVTLLTAAFVACLGHTFLRAVATTKVLNLLSSLVATGVFLSGGAVDPRLGAVAAVSMFLGGYAGGYLTLRASEVWLRRVFLAAVVLLALKTLLYDLLWSLVIRGG